MSVIFNTFAMNTETDSPVEIDAKPFKQRLVDELARHNKSKDEWAQITGLGIETVKNILNPKRDMGAIRVEYLEAFWKFDPSLDVHYIVTGQRLDKPTVTIDGPAHVRHNP
ncbi:hypothetical protein [Spirosoma sp. KUDC1026]|uniref:hypothetical protein n=1 Tax=Spirosoma sp. KUDC1026 TaxID=2745947 RepID=UPI00159B8AC2|nr:hypothetical protein [Spirosoma sp. KUDC1026]QKZ15212.1 hypothetical protein HU175_22330 [Spirosoma sp. KUDC1026]